MTSRPFGQTIDGHQTRLYTLKGAGGGVMEVTDYGGRVVRLLMPGRSGELADITLGFNEPGGYEEYDQYFGALIGRYGNRIANGGFTLDGRAYNLATNSQSGGLPCTLHGGPRGFNSTVWQAQPLRSGDTVGLKLALTSPDGDQGFPGKLEVVVRYWLTAGNTWRIEYEAVTDRATVINLTQHLYFNLKGEGCGDILDHALMIASDEVVPVNRGLIPSGALLPVAGTPFDFRTPQLIGRSIDAEHELLRFGNGYDLCWMLRNQDGTLALAATLHEARSGRSLEVWTTEPAMQFYSGNHLKAEWPAKEPGKWLMARGGLALETQHPPDAPNQSRFPATVLRPGAVYRSTTEYRFKVL